MTQDKAYKELHLRKQQARDMMFDMVRSKPMHMHMFDRMNDFLALRPSKNFPKWAMHELEGYVYGLRDAIEFTEIVNAYEFDDGRVLIIGSPEYNEEDPSWIGNHWQVIGAVWRKPNYLGHYSWYHYSTRENFLKD